MPGTCPPAGLRPSRCLCHPLSWRAGGRAWAPGGSFSECRPHRPGWPSGFTLRSVSSRLCPDLPPGSLPCGDDAGSVVCVPDTSPPVSRPPVTAAACGHRRSSPSALRSHLGGCLLTWGGVSPTNRGPAQPVGLLHASRPSPHVQGLTCCTATQVPPVPLQRLRCLPWGGGGVRPPWEVRPGLSRPHRQPGDPAGFTEKPFSPPRCSVTLVICQGRCTCDTPLGSARCHHGAHTALSQGLREGGDHSRLSGRWGPRGRRPPRPPALGTRSVTAAGCLSHRETFAIRFMPLWGPVRKMCHFTTVRFYKAPTAHTPILCNEGLVPSSAG